MEKKRVCIMEFDRSDRIFKMLREVSLSSIPTTGNKIVIDIEGIGYVFGVYDVHYADDSGIDVYVVRQSTISEYNDSKFPDII